jgi:DNA-binding CsgD family transcriptional regulator
MESGAPPAAADLLIRALAEPPPPSERVGVLREAARAEASAGRETACGRLEEALMLATQPRERAVIALEVAEAYAALFRWVDAVDVLERALAELGDRDDQLAARLEGELVICALHDARRASRVAAALAQLASRSLSGSPAEALAIGRGMAMILAGAPAQEAAAQLQLALAHAEPRAENWDTRAALLWSLIVAERFDAVGRAVAPMVEEVHRSGSARGFVAVYSTLGLLNLRLGKLPEADAAARVALRVLQEGDFGPGLAFAATVLADVAVEAGELDAAESLLALLPQDGWPAGVGTVLIPAARGRLRLAGDRPAEALADFRTCMAMFDPALWGTEMRDVGYMHARSGAAMALLRLGDPGGARELAEAELVDVLRFGAPRAVGIALRAAGLGRGSDGGLGLLEESVETLRSSQAALELAHSLTELGAALRRVGRRADARDPLAEGLELAARCGARPLAARARVELQATGARPRREWRSGVESLTPSELRIVRLAGEGRTNREIAHELYVTLKTVEGHLSRAYTKLGIEGRAQLVNVLEPEKSRVSTL